MSRASSFHVLARADGPLMPDVLFSNGSCFWAPNKAAHDTFIPCGNDYFEHFPCCKAGNNCLSNSACYDPEHGTTYIAGCSDPEYKDKSCPDKFAWKGECG